MSTTIDARGKILRIGDTVHKVEHRRAVNKGETNGRVLVEQKQYTVRRIHGDMVGLRESPKSKYAVAADSVIKQ